MKPHQKAAARSVVFMFCVAMVLAKSVEAQSPPCERTFAQSKTELEKALKQLQPSASGRLPTLDGFTPPGDRPLEHFQRGYYQYEVQVNSTPSGGALVRVSAKITAWYADPDPSKSGYQVLPSNGRLEADFLDRLTDALRSKASTANLPASPAPPQSKKKPGLPAPSISAPMPTDSAATGSIAASKGPATSGSSPFKLGNPVISDRAASLATQKAVAERHMEDLNKEAKGLEEILRNQAHPNNLVAVKKSDTPVLASPVESAKVLFLATAEDEFEILDLNANWVHVRISGLSRGWIRRSDLEMPRTSAPEVQVGSVPALGPEHFRVKDEQTATFPGTWEPLQGRTVRILTVQKTGGTPSDTGSQAKLEFTKSLFDKEYTELTKESTTAAGVVVIFDSEDGGMVAATSPALQLWKAGTLSDQAFWRRCFLDPPELFTSKEGQ